MKGFISALIVLFLIIAFVITNGIITRNILLGLENILLESEMGAAEDALKKAEKFFEKNEYILALTISDEMLGNIRGGIKEAIQATKTSDEEYLESIISRLICHVEQIRRLGGVGLDAIF